MTNPVGFAYVAGGVPGLRAVPAPGGASQISGGDPEIAALQGDVDADYACDGVGQWVNLRFDFTYTTSVPTSLAATLAAAGTEFCTLAVRWQQSDLGSGVDFGSCPPITDPAIADMTVSMAGFGDLAEGTEYRTDDNPSVTGSRTALGIDTVTGIDAGVIPRMFAAPYTMWTPQGLLLRPTPLTWPGRDPDNVANRAIWHTSEVADVTYAMSAIGVARPPGFGLVMLPAWFMTPFQPVTFPVACSISPLPPPTPTLIPPGTLTFGDPETGVVPTDRTAAGL